MTTSTHHKSLTHRMVLFGLAGSMVLSLAGSTIGSATAASWDYVPESFHQAVEHLAYYEEAIGSHGPVDVDALTEYLELIAEIEASKVVRERMAVHLNAANSTSGAVEATSGRSAALRTLQHAANSYGQSLMSMSMTIINSLSKISGVFIIDPTVIAPGYYETVPQDMYGAIVAGNGSGYGAALIIETTPGSGGYDYDYGSASGWGWDAGGGGDYYSEESYSTDYSSSNGGSSNGGSSNDSSCPDSEGEYSFDSAQDACSCPAVDWWGTDDNDDGTIDSSEGGSCDDLSRTQSCVPNWRDWYTIMAANDGRSFAMPDMIYSIPSTSVRAELMATMPDIISAMADGDIVTMTYTESWPIDGGGVAVGHPITTMMMMQTEAFDVLDQEAGISAALIGYTCSVNPVAMGGTMPPVLLEGDMGLIDADGVVTDGGHVQAAILNVMQ